MQLKDQVAIVTGSATGIGAACAERLAAQGARVVVNCTKSVTDAEATVGRIRAAGGEALLVQANVAEDADCRRMASAAVEKWGRIDILVNNAGTTRFADHAKLDLLSADDFIAIYRVNVIGAYQMVRACEPQLKASGFGRAVNVSSIAGVLGVSYGPAVIFAVGALFVLIVLLHYSTVISALTDRTVILAQRVAILEQRIGELERLRRNDP